MHSRIDTNDPRSSRLGQWMQTGGPSAGQSQMLFNSKGDIFDLTNYFIRSTDGGASWQDLTLPFSNQFIIGWAIAHDNIYIYLTDGSFFRSTDNGNTWKEIASIAGSGFYFY